jgi:hypothetical protein
MFAATLPLMGKMGQDLEDMSRYFGKASALQPGVLLNLLMSVPLIAYLGLFLVLYRVARPVAAQMLLANLRRNNGDLSRKAEISLWICGYLPVIVLYLLVARA